VAVPVDLAALTEVKLRSNHGGGNKRKSQPGAILHSSLCLVMEKRNGRSASAPSPSAFGAFWTCATPHHVLLKDRRRRSNTNAYASKWQNTLM